ncbi:uncharacterized protein KY384_005008 [Bacidia gigantensis]|uniref:uncharacterized protein n=1 Tax=Bacidia gigantensis TaxID=2732470 RepID=UPI001D04F545|nr:uncharacterized protein KY384_005008 [Bacidia gigantensis]KAG8530505.1 hypothetical protein KY384_005008 [Bacidia gigantensis]
MVELPAINTTQLQKCEDMLVDFKLVSPLSPPYSPTSVASGMASSTTKIQIEHPASGTTKPSDSFSKASMPFSSPDAKTSATHSPTNLPDVRASSTRDQGVLVPEAGLPTIPYSIPDHLSRPTGHRSFTMLEDSSFESTEAQVEELCLLVFALSNEWMERMNQSSDSSTRLMTFSAPELFKRGVCSLQALFRDILPDNFTDVLALLLVACAASYALHQNDDLYDWKAFFVDAFRWQHVLQSESEKCNLKQALECLACCDEFQNSLTIHSTSYMTGQNAVDDKNCILEETDNSSQEATVSSGAFGKGHRRLHPREALQALREGAVTMSCVTFLDGLAYTRISERNSALLPGHFAWYARQKESNVQDLVDHLIRPLQSAKGIEALFDIILDAEFQIHMGLLRDPREVEVALLYAGKLYSKTSQFYERFQAVVSLYCNWAMQQVDSNWRSPYYVAHLDNVLAIALEIETRQQNNLDMPAVNCWPNASVLELTQQKSPMTGNSHVSSASHRNYQSSTGTPLTATSGSTTISSIFSTCDSAGTTSTRMSQASSTSSRITTDHESLDGAQSLSEMYNIINGHYFEGVECAVPIRLRNLC